MPTDRPLPITDWYGLYRERWSNEICLSSVSHPAKFSRGLIRRIYDHLIEEGYIKPGDKILDPFAGVCLGALDAQRHGLHWFGCELELRFCDMGSHYDCPGFTKAEWKRLQHRIQRVNYTEYTHLCPDCAIAMTDIGDSRVIPAREPHRFEGNLDLWERRYRRLWPDTWGSAVLVQGDSRELGKVISEARALVSSPPFAAVTQGTGGSFGEMARRWNENPANEGKPGFRPNLAEGYRRSSFNDSYGTAPGQLANLPASDKGHAAVISSPPFAEAETRDRSPVSPGHVADCITRAYTQDRQGTTPGNLAAMEAGEDGLEAVVSSPPYVQSLKGGEGPGARYDFKTHSPKNTVKQTCDPDYGDAKGQLATMPEGDVEAVISSPPYAAGCAHTGGETKMTSGQGGPIKFVEYGTEDGQLAAMPNGQLGTSEPDDFWTAARTIVDQCYLVLKPGAVAVWVVKAFVRNKKVVDFPGQWAAMCEAAGFETVEWIRAWLTEDKGTQIDLWGEKHTKTVKRSSFFRRLYESKYPENAIDYEVVIIMRRKIE